MKTFNYMIRVRGDIGIILFIAFAVLALKGYNAAASWLALANLVMWSFIMLKLVKTRE